MNRADREKKKAWKQSERASARSAFPLSDEQMTSLFHFVDVSVGQHGCDHTRRFSEQWLTKHALPVAPVVEWLEKHGGFCDCEVIYNSHDHWEQNR